MTARDIFTTTENFCKFSDGKIFIPHHHSLNVLYGFHLWHHADDTATEFCIEVTYYNSDDIYTPYIKKMYIDKDQPVLVIEFESELFEDPNDLDYY